ncbi:MAG TPA: outer membrane lipoprotein-sorting protein [Gammaproteobacteria bacterium]|nr:outer membrane lipoprotein-sorting protein [Gammaproteobacteria bacterium]MCH78955.1 outer membrane lipoprotein-sorting protein [Gammaproteobacteria bacterium]
MLAVIRENLFIPLGFVGALGLSTAMAEPVPVGTQIDAGNVEQYKAMLPTGTYVNVKAGEVLKVIPTTPLEQLVDPKWLELTEANRGKAKMLDEAGTWGLADGSFWPGGYPFPGTDDPREMMANFQYHLTPDDIDTIPAGGHMGGFSLVNGDGKEYKRFIINLTQRRMTGRVWTPPLGAEPGYEDELYRTNTMFFEPYDSKGVISMNVIYRDQAALPDAYVYVPVLRRVRRLSSSQRADAIQGSDLTAGDVDTFADPLGMWDFTLLGTETLLVNQTGSPPSEGMLDNSVQPVASYYPSPYTAVESRRVHIIEATPRYSTIYSKKVLYVDSQTYRPAVGEFYDRQGQLLKTYEMNWNVKEDFTPSPNWIVIKNQQTGNASIFWVFDINANVGTPLSRVLTSSMRESSR